MTASQRESRHAPLPNRHRGSTLMLDLLMIAILVILAGLSFLYVYGLDKI